MQISGAGVNRDEEFVADGGERAHVWLRKSVHPRLLTHDHAHRIPTHIRCRSRRQRQLVKVLVSCWTGCASLCKGEKGERRIKSDLISATILQVDRFHVVILIGQRCHIWRSRHRIGYHVARRSRLLEKASWTVARVVNN